MHDLLTELLLSLFHPSPPALFANEVTWLSTAHTLPPETQVRLVVSVQRDADTSSSDCQVCNSTVSIVSNCSLWHLHYCCLMISAELICMTKFSPTHTLTQRMATTAMCFLVDGFVFLFLFFFFCYVLVFERLLISRIVSHRWKCTDNFVSSLPGKAASNSDFLCSLFFLSPSCSYVGHLGLQFAVWPGEQCTALHH